MKFIKSLSCTIVPRTCTVPVEWLNLVFEYWIDTNVIISDKYELVLVIQGNSI